MPLPRRQIREVQRMKTSEFRRFMDNYSRDLHQSSFREGYAKGTKDSQAADIKIILQTALEDVKGYGPVLHERMVEHIEEITKNIENNGKGVK